MIAFPVVTGNLTMLSAMLMVTLLAQVQQPGQICHPSPFTGKLICERPLSMTQPYMPVATPQQQSPAVSMCQSTGDGNKLCTGAQPRMCHTSDDGLEICVPLN